MALTRRDFLRAAGAAGALMAFRHPLGALAGPLGTLGSPGADRTSKLFGGLRLAHGDMHNHSHLSDGNGHPADAFPSMSHFGLDVAALTDHSTLSWGSFSIADICGEPFFPEAEDGNRHECRELFGLTEEGWETAGSLANLHNHDEEFVALRAFEWSSPFIGHINVWFSQRWIDPLHTAGIGPEGIGAEAHAFPELGPDVLQPLLDEATRLNPARGTGMAPFYEWLRADPNTPVLGGGGDGIACFNHPGREVGRFAFFKMFPEVRDQFVAMEIINRREDYLFKEYRKDQRSPLVECLNEGWHVGLIGVTDEHGTNWGEYQGKGRAGIWLKNELGLTRAGVREALVARRVFATREEGLRLDATANDVQMGNAFPLAGGAVSFEVDIDWGADRVGMPIEIQVLGPDEAYPEVVHVEETEIPAADAPPISFTVPGVEAGGWLVLRLADPTAPNNHPGPPDHRASQTHALAYSSPFWPA